MLYKEIFSLIAIVITFLAFFPYIRSIINNSIKPHVFSWVIWGSTTFIVFLAQLKDHGGVGAWPIGFSASITILIAFLAFAKRADVNITATDWLFFIAAMSSLPIWYFSSEPLWAVVMLTTVDVLGFGPTIRKAYEHPYSESLLFFFLFTIRNFCVILALEHYSLTTVLFPAAIMVASLSLLIMVSYRRRAVAD
jgi:hypothetical protein